MDTGGMLRLRTGQVDLGRQRLITSSGVVTLTTRETELLAYLANRAGQPVPREDLLVDVWHYRATNPTRAVDLAVKRLRSKIEPDPSDPVHVLSVHGVGYRFVPVDEDETPASFPEDAAPTISVATNLTPERTSFVGRAQEIAKLEELFAAGARLVTVTGPAGTGKTRLARRYGTDRAGSLPGGAWFCDLAEVRRLEGIVGLVVGALGLLAGTEAGPDQVGRALAAHGRVLVILDNFEHLVEHASATVGRWLDLAPEAVFLVTSRERLHVRGERIVELAPLPPTDALELLVDRAMAVRRGLELTPADREVLRDVVVQLDGIPLAIELAASRLGTLSPAQLLKRLSSRFRLLGDPRSDRPRRHATLEAALDWSWELMSAHERNALAALSVFEGGFSLEAAEEVLDSDEDGEDAPWPADLVQSLRDKSLLSMDDLAGGDLRYRLLESVREYAAGKLLGTDTSTPSGRATVDPVRARRRHAEYYLSEGEELASRLYGAGGVDRMEDLARERANLVAVARFAPDPEQRVRAALCLYPVLQARGPLAQLEELLDRAIDLARAEPTMDRRLLGRLLVDRGFHHYGRDRLSAAEADFEDASRVAPQHLDLHARARMGLGRVRCDQGRLEEAANCLRESIELFARLGDRSGEGRARELFAEVLQQQDCVEEAGAEYDRALRVLRRVGDRWTEGILFANLAAFLLERRHEPREAEIHANQALEILTEVGDHRATVVLLLGFAIALVRMARPIEALAKVDQARGIARRMGDRAREGQAASILGWALHELERLDEAETALEEALGILRAEGDRIQEAVALRRLAALREDQGRFLEAEHALLEAIDELQSRGGRIERAVTRLQLGMLRLDQGDLERALPVLDEASAEAKALMPWVCRQAEGLKAIAFASEGRVAEAEALLDALRAGSLDPREAELVAPVGAAVALARARGDETARARARALIDGPRGFAERRLALRLLARELDDHHPGPTSGPPPR